MKRLGWVLALALPLGATAAGDPASCTLPGTLVMEDASDDSGVQPGTGDQDFLDLQSLSIAEPVTLPGKLVFTFKVRGLSQTPPGVRWAVQFGAPTIAAGSEGWFVMMSTLPADDPSGTGAPQFLYGTTGITSLVATGVRTYTVLGPLEGSGYDADGTITLVLDKTAIGNPQPGEALDPVFPVVRTLVTPNGISFDESGNGYYEVLDPEICAGKSALPQGGALPAGGLLLLCVGAIVRRRVNR